MPFCPKCGSEIQNGARFCLSCGEAVMPGATRAPQPMPQPQVQQTYTAPVQQPVQQPQPQVQQTYTAPVQQPVQQPQPQVQQTYTAPVQQPVQQRPVQQRPAAQRPVRQTGNARKKSGGGKTGIIIAAIAGAAVILSLIGAGLFFVMRSGGSKAAGKGTALTELLDATAATHYNGGGSGKSRTKEKASGKDKADTEEAGEENEGGGGSSEGLIGPGASESEALAAEYDGSVDTQSTDYMSIDVSDGWFGMDGGIEGKYSGFSFGPGNGPGGTLDAYVYFDKEYTQADLDELMESTKQYAYEETTDVEDIVVDGVTLKGFEAVDSSIGDPKAIRQYMGLKDGKSIQICLKSSDDQGEIFYSPAAWSMLYSIKVK